MSGTLKKLKIYAYTDESFSQLDGSVEVPLNPASYKHTHKTNFTKTKLTDTGGDVRKFVGIEAQSVDFDIYFDATLSDGPTESVPDAIAAFKEVAYAFDGEIHSPKYLKVVWGEFQFKCRLSSLTIDYTLFAPSGTPLRAKATVSFLQYLSPKALRLLENKQSPDMTHVRTVRAGDTLPLLCHRIYGESAYYLAVARYNGLTQFRDLAPGMQIVFPPLR